MTTKEICRAIKRGEVVTLKDDPMKRICRDLFGGLVVVSLNDAEPDRLATLADKRKAVVFDVSMLPKRRTYKRKAT